MSRRIFFFFRQEIKENRKTPKVWVCMLVDGEEEVKFSMYNDKKGENGNQIRNII